MSEPKREKAATAQAKTVSLRRRSAGSPVIRSVRLSVALIEIRHTRWRVAGSGDQQAACW